MPASARRRVLRLALTLLGGAATAAAQVPAVAPSELRAGTLDAAHSVDGRLDEPAWAAADLIDAFTQADPREGEPASARTTVRVLAGPKALVIGIDCEQPSGVGVVSFNVRRDATLTQEDHVRIVLGPVHGRPLRLRVRGQPERRALRRHRQPRRRVGQPRVGRHLGRGDGQQRRRLECRGLDPVPHSELQARAADLALQRAAPHPGPARDRPLGLGRPPVPGDADESRRAAHRAAGDRSRTRTERTPGGDDRRRHPGAVGRRRGRVPAQPRRHQAAGREPAGLGHGEHRLRRDRGRHAAHQPDAVSFVLPREADVLPRRRRHLLVRSRPRPGRPAVLQPAHRPGRGDRGADHRRRQGQRPPGQHQRSARSSSAPTIAPASSTTRRSWAWPG